jgi:beta-galactosidase
MDSTSVLRDGRPWYPVMGEYHFARDRPERWAHELRKLRAGGVDVVATYLIWILHEEVEGDRRWHGHLDVRRFIQAAHDAGLEVMLRIGPWAHGETRNGGFPDWLQALPLEHRTDDPAYLALVDGWFGDIAAQLAGLFRDPAHPEAPIVAVQVDNELYDQPGHLATLRDRAEAAGIVAPLWVATGWGGAQLPLDRVVPVYAGYSDGFWDEATTEWPAYARMHFEYSTVRDDLSVGADVRGELLAEAVPEDHRHPFLTCELGGGMTTAYHRRPHVDPHDVAALGLTKIGSGSAWQGYYLYHGSTHVTGVLSGSQESHETAYPNDMPRKDYDFYAPVGAAGTLRPHYHLLRRQHLLLEQWGAALTQLPVILPQRADHDVRWSLRADDTSGYVFVTNHQPAVSPLPAVPGVQFSLLVGEHAVTLPSAPTEVPAGSYFVWPVRQAYGEIRALSATVQPITQVDDEAGTVVFFSAVPGIPVERALDADGEILGASPVETAAGVRWVPDAPPGTDCIVRVGSTRLVVLDEAQGARLWRVVLDGRPTVLLFDGGIVQVGDDVVVERWTDTDRVLRFPAATGGAAADTAPADTFDGLFQSVALPAWQPTTPVPWRELAAATGPAPVRTGGSMGRLSAPLDADFATAAVIEVSPALPEPALPEPGTPEPGTPGPGTPDTADAATVLTLEWSGDVARVELDGVLLADQFWSGRALELDLAPWRAQLAHSPLVVRILPWTPEAGFFVDRRHRGALVPGRAEVTGASLTVAPRIRL